MKTCTGRDFIRVLEREGWHLLCVHGSHHVYVKEGSDAKLPILVHDKTTLKRGLLTYLLKSAGLTEKDI
jgi:predicted RNA binding protein YcfA (HicA-like mRNA interferase family)